MLSTWLFIIIIGNSAQSMEMQNMSECMQLKEYADKQIAAKGELKGKAATGCFQNMGVRSKES